MKFYIALLLATLTLAGCAGTGVHNTSQAEALAQTVPDPHGQWKGVNCNDIYYSLPIKTPEDERLQYNKFVHCEAAQLPPIDPARREHFGEQYNPKKYLECKLKYQHTTSCDIYKLRRAENPEYWPYPDVPKPQWPDAPKEAAYKKGMNSKQYFEALCKAEAGEFIYKTVENVEGIYQVRPRKTEGTYEFEDRYVIEDPFNYTGVEITEEPQNYFVQPTHGKYQFYERPGPSGLYRKYWRDSRNPKGTHQTEINGHPQTIPYIVSDGVVNRPKARYGYVWRGISRTQDRNLKIAGGELAVIDLQTNQILAIRRGFARSGDVTNSSTGIYWDIAERCPPNTKSVANFIYKVLKPKTNQEVQGEEEK